MARPLRIEFEGAVYHVTARGNARQRIFLDDEDRQDFLSTLSAVVKRFAWICHAYCLMDNHYHLVIETPRGNLSQGMRQLNGVYAQQFNRRHDRVGHVLQGRYKTIVVDKDSYLLSVCRYIVLNPVRAGMASHPREWRWSSYRATAGTGRSPEFLAVDWVLSQFGERRAEARAHYKRFVREGMGEQSPWENLKGQIVLGAEEFLEKIKALIKKSENITEIPRVQRYAARPGLDELLPREGFAQRERQDAAIYMAYCEFGYSLKEIAEHLGLHYVTISRALKRAEGARK